MGKQMLTLSGRVIKKQSSVTPTEPKLYSLSTNANLPLALRSKKAFLIKDSVAVPTGFSHYFHLEGVQATGVDPANTTNLGKEFTLEDLITANSNLKSHKFDYWYELYTGCVCANKNNSIVINLEFDHGS